MLQILFLLSICDFVYIALRCQYVYVSGDLPVQQGQIVEVVAVDRRHIKNEVEELRHHFAHGRRHFRRHHGDQLTRGTRRT